MRRSAMILVLFASGCAPVVSETAICDGAETAIRDHATALSAPDVPDTAVLTGARLIALIDAGCGR